LPGDPLKTLVGDRVREHLHAAGAADPGVVRERVADGEDERGAGERLALEAVRVHRNVEPAVSDCILEQRCVQLDHVRDLKRAGGDRAGPGVDREPLEERVRAEPAEASFELCDALELRRDAVGRWRPRARLRQDLDVHARGWSLRDQPAGNHLSYPAPSTRKLGSTSTPSRTGARSIPVRRRAPSRDRRRQSLPCLP
jgi:hypothetical protein